MVGMAATQDLIQALQALGIDAGWDDLSGGVYGITLTHPAGEILISDRDDCLTAVDGKTDDYVSGFMAAVRTMPEEFRQYDGTGRQIYQTGMDTCAAYLSDDLLGVTDLQAEIPRVVQAVRDELGLW